MEEGQTGPCVGCGGEKFDPTVVGWHCFKESTSEHCRSAQRQGNGEREAHSRCGLQVLIPVTDLEAQPGL